MQLHVILYIAQCKYCTLHCIELYPISNCLTEIYLGNKTLTQSSYFGFDEIALRAVDGSAATVYNQKSCTHTGQYYRIMTSEHDYMIMSWYMIGTNL